MPRRSSARTASIQSAPVQPTPPSHTHALPDNLTLLRRQWKWAAFSQFFITFAHLLAMHDVTVADIEHDLAFGTSVVIPRIMQRLLYTLSYDRRITLDNWQTALRKQYLKRDPQANPIGPEPMSTPLHPSPSVPATTSASAEPDSIPQTPVDSQPPASTTAAESDQAVDSLHSIIQPSEYDSFKDPFDVEPGYKINWLDLPMLAKLDSMHLLTEWQFQNPTRLRQLMKSDDESASWRIEPIGYDAKRNAYWHIGDRLWIQRELPKPPKSLKRKRGLEAQAAKARPKSNFTKDRSTKKPRLAPANEDTSSNLRGRGRAAKAQAKLKLDAQAKELAELNRQAALQKSPARSRRRPTDGVSSNIAPKPVASRTVGTRISARLRGVQEEEWQPIPEDWLDGDVNGVTSKMSTRTVSRNNLEASKTGLESDNGSISDLTELSSETEDKEEPDEATMNHHVPEPQPPADDRGLEHPPNLPEGFIEWEMICVTLREWECIADRFEKSTYYLEKSLYKRLVTDIVPTMVDMLKEVEKKRKLEEALVHRKRSSRIAIKESEKEEALVAAKKKAEEEEKMGRARRVEARRQKEEEERIRRENAREQRRKEREAREASRKATSESSVQPDDLDGKTHLASGSTVLRRNKPQDKTAHTNGSASGTRTPIGDDWELDCEICHRRGINVDDGTPMMSCGMCSKWQHIACHDQADLQQGRPKRDWDAEDFVCKKCRLKKATNDKRHQNTSTSVVYRPAVPRHVGPQQNPYYSQISNIPPVLHDRPFSGHYPRPLNGSTSYIQGQISDIRSSTIPAQSAQSHGSHPMEHNTIAFSHYQPQDRAFTTIAKPQQHPYNAYGHTQAYGQSFAPNYNYAGPPRVGDHSTSRSQNMGPTQGVWNITTPANTPGYPTAPYIPRMEPSNSSPRQQQQPNRHVQGIVASSSGQNIPQPQGHPSSPSGVPGTQFATAQFRYHPTSYQAPP
ncbi:hypothetical protein BDQ12DRAFT_680331 [Crucibulum laeve]|uniref:Zinc finger PHD-type domain-containing protein n=1 Tax=Crucibulum laeve TaxID=68775 RepID=A0A5C3M3V0_9AGAR|nr:hypothetical protein BDQ12DRAFT_680331 [Crucibulum laeve]